MAKSTWNSSIQSDPSMGKDPLKRDSSGLGYPRPKSIFDIVEKASKGDQGFSSELPCPKDE
jgi:hypothetical protein